MTTTFVKMRNSYQFNKEYVDSIFSDKINSRVYKPSEIRSLIQNNDEMVVKSLLKLYSFQTEEEKYTNDSIFNNGIGFNGCDANFLTEIAKQCVHKNYITFQQVIYVRKKILKYANQLTKIANGAIKYEYLL